MAGFPDPHLGQLLGAVRTALSDELHARLHAAGYTDLRPAHGLVFHHLRAGGVRLSTLAELARITKQAMAEHVTELAELGYLVRLPDAADGRAKLIRPTEKCLDVMRLARESLWAIEAEWGEAIGVRRVAQMRESLEAIRVLYGEDRHRAAADAPAARAG